MWLLKKRNKIKLSILDKDGKPVYEQREAGDPCPEAAMYSQPLLWCHEVPDDSDSAKDALRRYKARTGNDIAGYESLTKNVDHQERQPSEDDRTKAQLIAEIKKFKGEYKKSDNKEALLVALSLAEKNYVPEDVTVDDVVSDEHVDSDDDSDDDANAETDVDEDADSSGDVSSEDDETETDEDFNPDADFDE